MTINHHTYGLLSYRLPLSLLILNSFYLATAWSEPTYGEQICHQPDFTCLNINRGDSWTTLFPNSEQRDIVKRVNRLNAFLRPGMTIALPVKLAHLAIFDVSPFARYIDALGEKVIIVDQQKAAWAAYDAYGALVWWGPVSSGIEHCPDVVGGCATPVGSFRITRKKDANCVSKTFPKRLDGHHGGGEMPYCMYFLKGFALHGSESIPGYRSSHGCIRLFTEDARWLNESFVDAPPDALKGTRVIINK